MAEPWLSEIRIMAFGFAPAGWAACDGQLLAITQNESLFEVIGTMYGGDGITTFGLPDLRSRTCLHLDNSAEYAQGQEGGAESIVLSVAQLPAHKHYIQANYAAEYPEPDDHFLGKQPVYAPYPNSQIVSMDADMIGNTGGGQPHGNLQPFAGVNFCIAITGKTPTRT